MKNAGRLVTIVFPVLAAMIWGGAFTAQSVSADAIGPFTFNAARFTLGFLALGAGLWVYNAVKKKSGAGSPGTDAKKALLGGLACGIPLCIATNLQQAGLAETASGKAGFITALYVVLVPVLGLLIGKKVSGTVWIGVGLSVIGLYLLCVSGRLSLAPSDLLILLCAFFFALHILVIDRVTREVSPVLLSCLQFGWTALLSWVCAFLFEAPSISQLSACIGPLLYCGLVSSAVAYTLQVVAQKYAEPVTLSILLSLESVFSVLSGALFLGERLSLREGIGCVVMFAAVLFAQIPRERLPFFRKRA